MQLIPKILFENDDLLVIDKPSGLVVHPDGKKEEYSLVDWILENYPAVTGVGEPLVMEYKGEQITIDRPGIVHRLDRETSGVMIIAKTQVAYEFLKKQFQDHVIKKEYIAIVQGKMNERGIIDEPIGRSSSDIRRWVSGKYARGTLRPAITRYVTEKTFLHNSEYFSVVRLFPQTGRTHQLRVHMKSVQHPIIGDGLYAPKTVGMLGFDRVALHAQRITFTDLQGSQQVISTELPEDFKSVVYS